jgi:hypothetical protein
LTSGTLRLEELDDELGLDEVLVYSYDRAPWNIPSARRNIDRIGREVVLHFLEKGG